MESLFFNTPNQRYKISKTKVDISNGIFFYDISNRKTQSIKLKNLDQMIMIVVVKYGTVTIENHIESKREILRENSVTIYGSSKQDFTINVNGEAFILFIADFFLKQYLSFDSNEPIDFLYNKIQKEIILEEINQQPIDALSLYLIEKIIHTKDEKSMRSIHCMHRVMEFITHRLSLLDMIDKQIDKEELKIASRAKSHLLNSFQNPPTIETLAHLCATNESKLKGEEPIYY